MHTTNRIASTRYRSVRAGDLAHSYPVAREAHGRIGVRELARVSRLPESRGLRLRVTAVSLALVALVALLLTSSPAVTATLGIVLVMGLFASTLVALVEWRTRDGGARPADAEPVPTSSAPTSRHRPTDAHRNDSQLTDPYLGGHS